MEGEGAAALNGGGVARACCAGCEGSGGGGGGGGAAHMDRDTIGAGDIAIIGAASCLGMIAPRPNDIPPGGALLHGIGIGGGIEHGATDAESNIGDGPP